MLTRFIRNQLVIFTVLSVVGMAVMAFAYVRVQYFLGIGRIAVTMNLPASGGLYRFGNVTYRGVEVGKVTDVKVVGGKQVQATLSLDGSVRIPADLTAHVRSMSAVGEQYVDLQPRGGSAPYLADGSVIAISDTTIPQRVGPMIDQLNALVGSLPKDKLNVLLDESYRGFNGAGYDFGSLIDSSKTLVDEFERVEQPSRQLIDDSGPLLDGQDQSAEAIRTWARGLAGITDQVRDNDQEFRSLLRQGPPAADAVSRLFTQVKPTLPILLANLTSVGQVLVTYNASIEQLLVLFPPTVAGYQAAGADRNATGMNLSDFSITIGDTPPCTVGFLPPSAWRSPADTTTLDTPDGLYCKLPQDAPVAVRGARNYPCVDVPGKRAPTVQGCHDPQPYRPLAMRQHALGPYPFDPNLVAQGVPLDSRALPDAQIFGPLEGTPLPPAADVEPPAPVPPPPDAAPGGLSIGTAGYNPSSGAYMGSDGRMYRQSNIGASPANWSELVLPGSR